MSAVQMEASPDVPTDVEDQLEKLRQQLEETVRTVQLRCGSTRATGDLSKATSVATAATSSVAGPLLSPSTLRLLDVDEVDSKNSLGMAGCWAGAEESTALSTEEELPTTEEQLIGEWSSTSVQAENEFQSIDHGPNQGGLEEAASIGSASCAAPSEIDGGDGAELTVPAPVDARQDCRRIAEPSHDRQVPASIDVTPSPGRQSSHSPPLPCQASASRVSNVPITISMRDLSEIKALKKPPPPVRMLMEVCCLLFHIQPVRQPDERNAKKHKLDYWEPARRYLLSDPFFLSKLRGYEADDISNVQRAKIKKYFQDPEFAAERVRNCSKAAHELYEWVRQLVGMESEMASPNATSLSPQPPARRVPSVPMSARRLPFNDLTVSEQVGRRG